MESLINTRNQVFIITIFLGLLGFSILIFLNVNLAIAFLLGNLIGLGYLYHLGSSVIKINPENKKTNSILRLALTMSFMVLIGQVLSLNLLFIFMGFLCNHFAILIKVLFEFVKDKVRQN